ncbi:MAG: hypothetical protein MJ002_01155 [Paludibacteraceae bacterium]|nr:hypothetical protein [Paludibacteraceae bacterium]
MSRLQRFEFAYKVITRNIIEPIKVYNKSKGGVRRIHFTLILGQVWVYGGLLRLRKY